jgi:thiol-disulfide isomerase/thioredoxin
VLPAFDLPSATGGHISDKYLRESNAALVVFGCNHCPYVKGSEDMLAEIVREFTPQGLRCVVINSNDAVKYPEDSFEKMVEKATGSDLPYSYLYDESQQIAKAFDAACTPEFYLFDSAGVLMYHGAINDSPRDATKVTKDYLSQAIAAVLDGKVPSPQFVHPLGCSIKWK